MDDGFYYADWDNPGNLPVVAGFIVQDGKVHPSETAPIIGWARGKPAPVLRRWVEDKGGQVLLVTRFERLF